MADGRVSALVYIANPTPARTIAMLSTREIKDLYIYITEFSRRCLHRLLLRDFSLLERHARSGGTGDTFFPEFFLGEGWVRRYFFYKL